MAIFNLADAGSDRSVTITIPKEYDSYFADWYQDTKEVGDTPAKFALRNLGLQALRHYKHKRVNELSESTETVIEGSNSEIAQFITSNNLD